ncbi:MAG TPA: HAD-IIA family hydrolase [Chloroflexota bacterium]|nr:HAD-IIA family hydrolase [Chloroflexota bacterium]
MLTFLCDLDGVIYRDREPVPGAAPTIAALRAAGHRVLFATNNGTSRREEFVARLAQVGVPATIEELGTSGYATTQYLRTLPRPPARVLVIGAEALRAELEAGGLHALLAPLPDGARIAPDHVPDCVVVSLDRQFTFQKLAQAQQAVLHGALLVATNRDPQFPGADGIYPGAGSIVAAVETACQQQAIAIGKPEPLLYQMLLQATGADLARTIVVGDNLQTDIAAAAAMDLPSVLVLTGVSRREDVAHAPAKPTLVVQTLPELLTYDLESLIRRPAR